MWKLNQEILELEVALEIMVYSFDFIDKKLKVHRYKSSCSSFKWFKFPTLNTNV